MLPATLQLGEYSLSRPPHGDKVLWWLFLISAFADGVETGDPGRNQRASALDLSELLHVRSTLLTLRRRMIVSSTDPSNAFPGNRIPLLHLFAEFYESCRLRVLLLRSELGNEGHL